MHLSAFLAVATVVMLTPGADMALVTKNALLHGRRAALATALGVNLGTAFWVVSAALGLAAIVRASTTAFAVIKIAGALYLIFLGVQALRSARRADDPETAVREPMRARTALRQGVLSNLLNPKIAVFFTSLLPQFVGAHGSIAGRLLLLGALFNVMGLCWLTGYALLAARGRDQLRRPAVRRAMERLSAVVLVGFGLRLAAETHP